MPLFYDLTTLYILGQKFVKFFVGFLENLRYQKDVLKLTNLYLVDIGEVIPYLHTIAIFITTYLPSLVNLVKKCPLTASMPALWLFQ